jgi:hypothetical protein
VKVSDSAAEPAFAKQRDALFGRVLLDRRRDFQNWDLAGCRVPGAPAAALGVWVAKQQEGASVSK